MEKKHFIYSCAILFFLAVFSAICVTLYTNVREIDSLRRTNDSIRTELTRATETNRELAEQLDDCTRRVEQCKFILSDLDGLANSNIGTIREAIETIEELRYEIACLSYYLDGVDTDSYYEWLDNWLEAQGIEVVR